MPGAVGSTQTTRSFAHIPNETRDYWWQDACTLSHGYGFGF